MGEAKKESWEWIKAIMAAVAIAFVVRTFFLTPIVVQGDSMMPTLENQERMIVTKIGEPKRFDIVVFHANEENDYIKRVIGLPGDHLEYKDDVLYVNGKPYEEKYLKKYKEENSFGGPLTGDFSADVPEGMIFVMGDNRRNSTDSRHIGPVKVEEIIGSTKVIFWPVNKMEILAE
ncbi:signal peptidase I [Mesobacillus campisalis]|uniref:Signal peptidase I n=1 Tax=Mesobacillus campisalis TaxID=1408103 RepID=A0A0M2SY52_9BACI|nr:signal peptidase I [Mesobacillus campisalis]KKK38636.1 signal peptidase I [Mesobacillus campisalis]